MVDQQMYRYVYIYTFHTYLSFGVDLEVPWCEVLVALQVDVEAAEVDVALVQVEQHLQSKYMINR